VQICGEESYGTGSSHVREKDGLWAVLYWLQVLAVTGGSVESLVRELWRAHGRCVYSRHDYEGIAAAQAEQLMRQLREKLPTLAGQCIAGCAIAMADDFAYTDPVDGSSTSRQGVRLVLVDGSRVIFRLSGTGTEGATLRLYLERHEPDASRHDLDTQQALQALVDLAESVAQVRAFTGMDHPTVMT